jgi:hypothetical protein
MYTYLVEIIFLGNKIILSEYKSKICFRSIYWWKKQNQYDFCGIIIEIELKFNFITLFFNLSWFRANLKGILDKSNNSHFFQITKITIQW